MCTTPDNATVILVVEDDPLIHDFETAVLRRAGYHVLSATNGIDGATVFSRCFEEISLVVTDIGLPGMDGLELGAFVRKIRPDMSLMFASGSIDANNRAAVERIRDSRFLAKPFTAAELLANVSELIATAGPFVSGPRVMRLL
jgi:two-component system, cell cycle sensor histidine kinase and response regulator CckA